MKRKTSVSRRLMTLVAAQTVTVIFLILVALRAVAIISLDAREMYRFQLLPIADIATALEAAGQLQQLANSDVNRSLLKPELTAARLTDDLSQFYGRYINQWETARGATEDARKFREELVRTGKIAILTKELDALHELKTSLNSLQQSQENSANSVTGQMQSQSERIAKVRDSLAALLSINVEYATIDNEHVIEQSRQTRILMIALGLSGAIASLLLGLHVHKAIAPRITRLVSKVKKFRDFGVNEKVIENGTDEITVLANALDAGFAAIAERDRERDQFLAVAAHELKTPITSIQGFATLLIANGTTSEARQKALEIISRQAWRLSRLIEGIFLMVRARSGQLKFRPSPFDFSALVERLLQELKPLMSHQPASVNIPPNIHVLGDETLLEYALWSLFTCASALSDNGSRLNIRLKHVHAQTHLEVQPTGITLLPEDIEPLFTPFRAIEYENNTGVRGAVGLYLSREIARVHNGRLYVSSASEGGSIFVLELPS